LRNLAEKAPAGPKMLFLLLCLIAALYFNDTVVLAILNLSMVFTCLVLSESFSGIMTIVRRIAFGFPFIVLIFVLSEYGVSKDWATAASDGFAGSILFILKIYFVVLANLFFVYTTEPREIASALRRMRVPQELCLMMLIILRFFPVMFEEAMSVYQAQRARGFEFRRMLNLSNWLPLAVPLVISVMRKSHDLAISMELKGMFAGGSISKELDLVDVPCNRRTTDKERTSLSTTK